MNNIIVLVIFTFSISTFAQTETKTKLEKMTELNTRKTLEITEKTSHIKQDATKLKPIIAIKEIKQNKSNSNQHVPNKTKLDVVGKFVALNQKEVAAFEISAGLTATVTTSLAISSASPLTIGQKYKLRNHFTRWAGPLSLIMIVDANRRLWTPSEYDFLMEDYKKSLVYIDENRNPDKKVTKEKVVNSHSKSFTCEEQ